jgi:hypothetical protein
VKLPDEQLVDAAMQAYWDHSWRGQRPQIYESQMPELMIVLRPVFEAWFIPRRSRVQARKPAKVDKGSQSRARTLVHARSGGHCEANIAGWCRTGATDWHHRKARSLGGRWDASNGMHLCRACHAWITEHPLGAAKRGWYLATGQEPSVAPMKRFGEWVLLDNDGGFEPVAVVGGGFSAEQETQE